VSVGGSGAPVESIPPLILLKARRKPRTEAVGTESPVFSIEMGSFGRRLDGKRLVPLVLRRPGVSVEDSKA
jgi:hypothetical protein